VEFKGVGTWPRMGPRGQSMRDNDQGRAIPWTPGEHAYD
jgi:hypothetical protein